MSEQVPTCLPVPTDISDTTPKAALAILCLARGNGTRGRVLGSSGDCSVQVQEDDTGRCFLALYRNGRAASAWRWEVSSTGVRRIGFRELRRMLTLRKRLREAQDKMRETSE